MAFAFGSKPVSPAEQMKNWTTALRKEHRALGREILRIQREEEKVKRNLKLQAKKAGVSKQSLVPMAKALVKSEKARDRMLETQTRINSVIMTLKTQQATMKVSGVMQKSSQVMSQMSRLISVPQMHAVAQGLAKEMMKAGIMEEMVEDAFNAVEEDGIEEEADKEVDRIIEQVTTGQLSAVGAASREIVKEKPKEVVEDDGDLDDMKERLAKLSS
jgi:charged multivesicular body protein 3